MLYESEEWPRRGNDNGAGRNGKALGESLCALGRGSEKKGALRAMVLPKPLDRRRGLHGQLTRGHDYE